MADNDLVCPRCQGRGCRLGREEIDADTTIGDVVCDRCRGSGLMIQARELGSVEAALASDEAGGVWLDFVGHVGDGLIWLLPWGYTLDQRRFSIKHDFFYADEDVVAFMQDRNVLVGLFRIQADSPRHLEMVYRLACGEDAAVPTFVMPRQAG